MHHFEYCAPLVQTFWPVTTQPSPSLTARVLSAARSEPASGSEKPWHQISSAERIGARKRSFCSSVPQTISVGPPSSSPRTFARSGPARVVECALPVAAPRVARVLAALGGLGRRRVLGEPAAQLVAEGGLRLGEGQVHRARRLAARGLI